MRAQTIIPIFALAFSACTCLSTSADAQATSHGYLCTVDCSGHEAGYQWAEDHDITDPSECGGNSQSFIEGCMAYAGEPGPHSDDDSLTDDLSADDDNPDDDPDAG